MQLFLDEAKITKKKRGKCWSSTNPMFSWIGKVINSMRQNGQSYNDCVGWALFSVFLLPFAGFVLFTVPFCCHFAMLSQVFECVCVCMFLVCREVIFFRLKSLSHNKIGIASVKVKESMHEWEWCNLYGSCLICEKPLMFLNISMNARAPQHSQTHTRRYRQKETCIHSFQSDSVLKGGVLW